MVFLQYYIPNDIDACAFDFSIRLTCESAMKAIDRSTNQSVAVGPHPPTVGFSGISKLRLVNRRAILTKDVAANRAALSWAGEASVIGWQSRYR